MSHKLSLELESLELESLELDEIEIVSGNEALESLTLGHGMVEIGASVGDTACCSCCLVCCCCA